MAYLRDLVFSFTSGLEIVLTVRVSDIATLESGETVRLVEVGNDVLSAQFLNVGAALWQLKVSAGGRDRSVCLSHPDPRDYAKNAPYFGCTVGPVANRIRGARFDLDGVCYQLVANEGCNQLHGGPSGFSHRCWDLSPGPTSDSITFTLHRPAGEGGYPGNLDVAVTWTLLDDELRFEWSARADASTPVSLTNHAYWNLAGGGTIEEHQLRVEAKKLVEVDAELIPTGKLLSLDGSAFDLSSAIRLGGAIRDVPGAGIDHSYVLDSEATTVLTAPDCELELQVCTSLPGIQIYTGHMLDGSPEVAGYGPLSAVCLETQFLPDTPNNSAFPTCTVGAGETMQHWTTYRFISPTR